MANINDLPNEILEFVFSLLPPYLDLEQCAAVCKRWSLLARNVHARKKSSLYKGLVEFNLCWEENVCGSNPRIAARFGHASAMHRNSMYVFGGASSHDTTFNDLWKFDLSRREWVRPIAMGTYPSPKAGASLVCHRDSLILFGGWRHPSTVLHMYTLIDDLHVYKIPENRWTIHNNPSYGPPPMTGHSATVHRNKMVLFGGYVMHQESLHTSNDIWVLDLEKLTWKKPTVSNRKPPPRYGQYQMAVGEDHILVLGGTGGVNRTFNDAWLLDMQRDTWSWKRVEIRNRKGPHPQNWCYPACNVGSKVIVLGPTSPNDFQIIRICPNRIVSHREPNIPRNPPAALQRPNLPPPAQPAPPVARPASPRIQRSNPVLPSPPAPLPPPAAAAAAPVSNGVSASEPKPGPSGLRAGAPKSPSSTRPLITIRPLPLHTIRSAFARQSSDDDHLPKRFNQQNLPEQSHMEMAAFSVPPSMPRAVSSRERQLQQLIKMEAKLFGVQCAKKDGQEQPPPPPAPDARLQRGSLKTAAAAAPEVAPAAPAVSGPSNGAPAGNALQPVSEPVTPKRCKRNGLAIYVCDVSNILPSGGGEPWIEWQELKNSGQIAGAPDHYTFSTMVSGNGELIVFGGVYKNPQVRSENMFVSNSVHFLTVPTAVV
ncbi:F-box only protein 42 [Anopheles cruzii]|uniref:F-box only protein 42 n=1 Tax=Anopheles cruzii TaxID=68878 RepID=UPI0022EC8A7E|nr:F-box only protein 42 [Anopheles cruzii]